MSRIAQKGQDITPIGKTSADTFQQPEEEEVLKGGGGIISKFLNGREFWGVREKKNKTYIFLKPDDILFQAKWVYLF